MPAFGRYVDPTKPLANHPLNEGMLLEWSAVPNPGWRGGFTIRDLARGSHIPNDGTLVAGTSGSLPLWGGPAGRPGGFGSIYANGFQAAPAYVSASLASLSTYTFGLWVLVTTDNESAMCVALQQHDLVCRGATSAFLLQQDGGSFPSQSSTFTPAVGVWYFVVVTYAGPSAGQVKIYVDGTDVTSGTTTAIPAPTGTSVAVPKGVGFSGQDQFFDGFFVNSRAFSADDVAAFYAESKAGNPNRYNWLDRTYYPPAFFVPAGGATFSAALTLAMQAGYLESMTSAQGLSETLGVSALLVDQSLIAGAVTSALGSSASQSQGDLGVTSSTSSLNVAAATAQSALAALLSALTLATSESMAVSGLPASAIAMTLSEISDMLVSENITFVKTLTTALSAAAGMSESELATLAGNVVLVLSVAIAIDSREVVTTLLLLGVAAAEARDVAGVYSQALVLAVTALLRELNTSAIETELIRLVLEAWTKSTLIDETFTKSTLTQEEWIGP